jgi:hypothetical protein
MILVVIMVLILVTVMVMSTPFPAPHRQCGRHYRAPYSDDGHYGYGGHDCDDNI